jgi:4-oxalocrotonate tautomerase
MAIAIVSQEDIMPVVTIQVPAGALDADKKATMISKVTDAVVEAEGIPAVRQGTFVLIEEVPDGGWGIGGRAFTLEAMKAALAKAAATA